MTAEKWLPVVGYEGLYEVSDLGSVRSLPRRVAQGHGWRDLPGGVLPRHIEDAGYVTVGLSRDGRRCTVRVHRIVLVAFVGPCPDGLEARHFPDRDPQNCCAANLCWGTHSENIQDRRTHGTAPIGERSGSAKLTADAVRTAKARLAAGETQLAIATDLGISRSLIQAIKSGKVWSHVG